TLFIAGCADNKNRLRVSAESNVIEVENESVKATFTINDSFIVQQFFALENGSWALVAESFRPESKIPTEATQLFNTDLDPAHRFLVSEALTEMSVESQNEDEIIIRLSGKTNETPI